MNSSASKSATDAASESSSSSFAAETPDFNDHSNASPIPNREIDSQSPAAARSEEYRQLFRLPPEEVLVQDFNCAYQGSILLQGHMYLFVHYICFYSKIFGFETKKIIPFHEVTSVKKAKTAGIFPNAIEVFTGGKKYFFASFLSRDEALNLIRDGWLQHGNGSNLIAEQQVSVSMIQIQVADELEQDVELVRNTNSSSSATLAWNVENFNAPQIRESFKEVGQTKFPIKVEEFFYLFFSDAAAKFVESFHSRCGDKDFRCSLWYIDDKSGHARNVSFQHPIKIYFGAKFGSCQEVQKFRVYRNSHLIIETSQEISDVCFGDCFHVEVEAVSDPFY